MTALKASMSIFVVLALGAFYQPIRAENSLPEVTQKQIAEYLELSESKYGLAGQSVAILRDGELVYTGARGYANLELQVKATVETVYTLYSVAKLFVNVALMQLVESGQVDTTAPLGQYLPDLPEAWRSITVQQVHAHVSGLPEYYQWPRPTPENADAALASVRSKPFEFEIGSANRYNQTNFLLLKMVIENVTGEDFESYMTKQMIDSLGLKNTSYGGEFAVVPKRATAYRATPEGVKRNVFIDQPDYFFASSGLNSNVLDLATWLSALLDGRLVSKESLDTMWSPFYLSDGSLSFFTSGWEYTRKDGVTAVGHGGGNRVAVHHYFKDSGENVSVIYLANGGAKDYWPNGISADLAALVFASMKQPDTES